MALNELPNLWTSDSLGELVIVERGSSPRPIKNFLTEDNGVNWIKIGDVKEGQKYVTKTKEQITKEGAEKSRFVKVGDFILSNSMSFGRPYIMAIDGYIHDGWFALRLPKDINSDYFYYLLSSSYVQDQFSQLAVGGVVKNISGDLVKKAELPLPPLAEQKFIAEKLDKLLAKVDSIKARLDAVPDTLKRFRQSVLAAAVNGKLTEEWREKFKPAIVDIASISEEQFSSGLTMGNFGKKKDRSPDIADEESRKFVNHIAGWPSIRLGALCECVVPNRDKPKSFSGGYHWLLTPNFDEQSIWIDYKEIENGLSEDEVITYRAKIIEPGNVIMTCVGRVGLSAVLEESSVINQQLHAFKVNKHIKAEYLAYCVRANVEYYEDKATSTTVKYLNKTACNSLPIPLPTIEEQTEIVRCVEKLFAYADKVEAEVNAAQERVNKLTQSILAKAFRGELTAKWREQNPDLISGENSAEALLEKIKAEREKLKSKKKTRTKK